jgi:glycosyltransferase involved in cell wall biosynthesis
MHVVVASHHRLPVEGYGGSQRVVVALVRGLAALGHRVTLLAQPGTRVPEAAKVVEVPPKILKDAGTDLTPFLPDGADILHVHFPLKRGPATLPFVQTLHGNWKAGLALLPHTIFVSRDHARRYGSDAFVYNGLDPGEFVFRRRKEQWDLFLGRLHSTKGYHWAIEAAKRTGRRLIVAGGWRPSFTAAVKYVGEVDGKRKAALLARARCLWMPALWDEPFGLTTIEALFSGTPVLGTHRGALPEILTPAVGALCDTLEEMLAAAETIGTRSPDACRAHAERHFTHRVMAEEYLRMYGAVIAAGTLPPGRPTPYTSS